MIRHTLLLCTLLLGIPHLHGAVVFKMGTQAPKGSAWDEIMREMAFKWKTATNGEVQLKIYAGGETGDESDMIRKMRIGQLNAAAISDSGLADIDPSAYALMIPMMFDSYEEWDFVRRTINPLMEQRLREKGFVVLAWSDVGWVHFFSIRKLTLPSELQKMKLASSLSQPKAVEILKWAGFNPVPISTADLVTGLQTHLIEALYVPLILAEGTNLYRDAPNMLDLKWAPLQGAVIVRESDWERVPDAYRGVIQDLTREAADRLRTDTREREQASLSAMKARGLQVWEIPAEIQVEWHERTAAAYPRIRNDLVSPMIFDKVVKLVQEYRRQNAAE